MIPFLIWSLPIGNWKTELVAVSTTVFSTAGFIGGDMLEDFEREFAGSAMPATASAWTTAPTRVRFALMAAGVEHGDIVITVPNTFIATTEAISQAGAQVAFVDIDEKHLPRWTRKSCAKFLENDCRFDAAAKKLFHKKSGKPGDRGCSGASLRANARPWIPLWRWPPSIT